MKPSLFQAIKNAAMQMRQEPVAHAKDIIDEYNFGKSIYGPYRSEAGLTYGNGRGRYQDAFDVSSSKTVWPDEPVKGPYEIRYNSPEYKVSQKIKGYNANLIDAIKNGEYSWEGKKAFLKDNSFGPEDYANLDALDMAMSRGMENKSWQDAAKAANKVENGKSVEGKSPMKTFRVRYTQHAPDNIFVTEKQFTENIKARNAEEAANKFYKGRNSTGVNWDGTRAHLWYSIDDVKLQ